MSDRKIIGILQPVYLPWMGYFEQMAYVDQFIFMDDVQYTRHDWRNRNRIKTVNGSIWLTVPVKKHSQKTAIRHIEINYTHNWIYKHLKSIELNYRKTPYFQPLFSEIETILTSRPTMLVDLSCRLIHLLCTYLDIGTPTDFSSNAPKHAADRSGRVIEICRHFRAHVLYNGAKSAAYLKVDQFREEGIALIFQNYQHPVYPQLYDRFLSHQSVLDLIMNTGPEAGAILRSSPVKAGELSTSLRIDR